MPLPRNMAPSPFMEKNMSAVSSIKTNTALHLFSLQSLSSIDRRIKALALSVLTLVIALILYKQYKNESTFNPTRIKSVENFVSNLIDTKQPQPTDSIFKNLKSVEDKMLY